MPKVVSFAKIAPAATAEAPKPAEATPAAATPPATPPVTPASQTIVPRQNAYVGAADDNEGVDASDIKLPRLRLLQGTSDKALLAKFGFGALLFKDSVLIARPAGDAQRPAVTGRIVFVRLLSKSYTERVAKFGDASGFARSLAEVEEQGGTPDWRESKENKKSGSQKPWYQVNANCLLLVEKPEGADDDHFPFEAGGKLYAPALYSVKSFAYDTFFQEIATARATGELRKGGWASRSINLDVEVRAGKGNAEFAVPVVSFGEHTPDDVKALAAEYSTGQ